MVQEENTFQLLPARQLDEDKTVIDALRVLDNIKDVEDRHGILLVVVDKQEKFKGIISPGDLRRAILKGNPRSMPLKEIIAKNPVYIKFDKLKNPLHVRRIFDVLKGRYGIQGLLYAMVPVLSEDRRVLGLVSVNSLESYVSIPVSTSGHNTVLIVGGAGYIGSVLARLLLKNNWSVKILDKLLYTKDSLNGLENERFQFIHGDAANIDNIVNAVEDVDAVVYLAELVGDPACSMAPQTALKSNYLAVTSMAHLCSHLNINRFIYTSSCSVYGASKNPDNILTENSLLRPLSLYARIKALVEESILSVCNLPNPLFAPTILRLGTVFGHSYRPRFDLVVNAFAKNAHQNGEIEIFGGNQWRPFVHVKDVCQAIWKVLNAPTEKVRSQVFNVGGNDENHTINQLADIACEVFPNTKVLKKDEITDARNYRVDFSKIEKTLGFKAKIGVKDGMQEIKEVFESKVFTNLDDPKYSNFKTLQELNLV